MLSTIDLIIIAVYIVGTTLLGGLFAGKQRDLKTYFVGDRNVRWWLVLTSIVATETSTVTFLSVPGYAFDPDKGNFTFLQLAIGYLIGRIVISILLLPGYFRGECFSVYELLRDRFGPSVQRTASALFLITRTLADGLRLFLTAILLQQFTGWNIYWSIGAMALVTVVYTYLGGMQAVIWTDLIQFVIYVLGAVIAGVILLQMLPGGWSEFVRVGMERDKFRIFEFDWDPTNSRSLLAGLIGGAFFSMASHGADQIMVQRYLCARGLREARIALISSGFVVFLQFVLFLAIGVGLYALTQSGVLQLPDRMKNDAVFGHFIIHHLPVGMIGLVIAAVLAAAMSTLSSSLNSSAGAYMADFYRPAFPDRTDAQYLRVSRTATLVWGILQTAVAVGAAMIDSSESIVLKVLSIAAITTGIVLGIFLLGLLFRTTSPQSALFGMVCGATAVLSLVIPTFFKITVLAWPWYTLVGSGVTIVAARVWEMTRSHGPSDHRNP